MKNEGKEGEIGHGERKEEREGGGCSRF